jgi:hypothetical protein
MHGVIVDRIEIDSRNPAFGRVYIRDPGGGREYMTFFYEFKEKFSGIAILTTKGK